MNDQSFGTLGYIITEYKQQHKAGFTTTAQSGGVCGRLPSFNHRTAETKTKNHTRLGLIWKNLTI